MKVKALTDFAKLKERIIKNDNDPLNDFIQCRHVDNENFIMVLKDGDIEYVKRIVLKDKVYSNPTKTNFFLPIKILKKMISGYDITELTIDDEVKQIHLYLNNGTSNPHYTFYNVGCKADPEDYKIEGGEKEPLAITENRFSIILNLNTLAKIKNAGSDKVILSMKLGDNEKKIFFIGTKNDKLALEGVITQPIESFNFKEKNTKTLDSLKHSENKAITEPSKPPCKFEVNDKVTIGNDDYVYTIQKITFYPPKNSWTIRIIGENGDELLASDDKLKLVEKQEAIKPPTVDEVEPCKFKVGDIVHRKNNEFNDPNIPLTITKILSVQTIPLYKVTDNDIGSFNIWEDALYIPLKSEPYTHPCKFKVADKVMFLKGYIEHYKKTSPNNCKGVYYKDGVWDIISIEWIDFTGDYKISLLQKHTGAKMWANFLELAEKQETTPLEPKKLNQTAVESDVPTPEPTNGKEKQHKRIDCDRFYNADLSHKLELHSLKHGYTSNLWATWRRMLSNNYRVNRGEKGITIKASSFSFTLFNVEQCQEIEAKQNKIGA